MLLFITSLLGISVQSPRLTELSAPVHRIRAPKAHITMGALQLLDDDDTIDWNELGLTRPSSVYLPRQNKEGTSASRRGSNRRLLPVHHKTTERKLVSFGPSGLQLAVSLVMRRPDQSPIEEKAQEDISVKVPAKRKTNRPPDLER